MPLLHIDQFTLPSPNLNPKSSLQRFSSHFNFKNSKSGFCAARSVSCLFPCVSSFVTVSLIRSSKFFPANVARIRLFTCNRVFIRGIELIISFCTIHECGSSYNNRSFLRTSLMKNHTRCNKVFEWFLNG